MSTLTLQNKDTTPNLDGPNDLKPVVKTTRILENEAAEAAEASVKTKTTKTEE